MKKRCIACHVSKEVEAYYHHPMMGDGHLGKCKECCKKQARERYNVLRRNSAWRDKERARGRDKARRLYNTGPNWKSPLAPKRAKTRAQNMTQRAVRKGALMRPEACGDCGDMRRRLHAHHEDYTKPLEVTWVCPTCHRRRHALFPERIKSSPGTLC